MSDRTVHASYPGLEIVRYDRAGKWYFEPTQTSLPRQQVTVGQAADAAIWALDYYKDEAKVNWDRHGGSAFERRIMDDAAERLGLKS
jgi:hypothetical protein